MSSISLPAELIEAIIDEVGHLNDRPTLMACSLVSLAFVFPSQKHLFREIDIDRQVPRKKAHQRFHKLLCMRPHLGAHILELRLGDDSEDDFGGGRSWIMQSKSTLPKTLSLLPRLEAFSLTFHPDVVNWKTIPAETRSAMGRLFRLPSLKAVSLAFIAVFPPQLLLSLTRLSYLALSCVEVDNAALIMDNSSYLQSRWESNLQSLLIRGASPQTIALIADALSQSSARTLRKLAVTPTFEGGFSEAVGELMKSSGSNIITFEWLPSIHFTTSAGPINLSTLPHLHSLRFALSFRKTHAHGAFPQVLRLLTQLSESTAQNQVQTITFDCHVILQFDAKKMMLEWKPLDAVLSKPAFAALKDIKIRLPTYTSPTEERHRFTLAFQDFLPLLQAKGVTTSVQNLEEVEKTSLLKELY